MKIRRLRTSEGWFLTCVNDGRPKFRRNHPVMGDLGDRDCREDISLKNMYWRPSVA